MEMDDTLLFEQWLDHLSTLDEAGSLTFDSALDKDSISSQQQQPLALNVKRSAEQSNLSAISTRPLKQQKNSAWDSSKFVNSCVKTRNQVGIVRRPEEEVSWSSSSSHCFVVFDNSSNFENENYMLKPRQGSKRLTSTTGVSHDTKVPYSQAQEHILAERKRRERINERLISLSKLIPGLSKMDRATVLQDAVKYIKQLQEMVKTLEEKTDKIKTMQSVVFVKRHEVSKFDNIDGVQNINSSSDEISSDGSITTESLLPEIEARVCNKDVFISVHCEKRKGVLEKLVAKIEKLHLTVVNSSVMSFGDFALNISVVAQMDEEYNMNLNQLVKNVRGAFENH